MLFPFRFSLRLFCRFRVVFQKSRKGKCFSLTFPALFIIKLSSTCAPAGAFNCTCFPYEIYHACQGSDGVRFYCTILTHILKYIFDRLQLTFSVNCHRPFNPRDCAIILLPFISLFRSVIFRWVV